MALRKGHGDCKGSPRIEVLPADELPDPVAVEPAQLARRADGTIASSEAARELGARGGLAKAQKKKLLQGLGLANVSEGAKIGPYHKASQAWLDAQLALYAAMCGGAIGPGPSSMLGNAALALCWSRYFTDAAAEAENDRERDKFVSQATRLWDSMKQQQLAAYELGVREAKMRAELSENAGFDAFEAALEQQKQAEDGSSE